MHCYTCCLPGNGGEIQCRANDEGDARYIFKQMLGMRLPWGTCVFLGWRVKKIDFALESVA